MAVLHGIYSGSVSKVMDFGCFVELDPRAVWQGKREGLVHASQLTSGGHRADPKACVRRGQPVRVKVISLAGSRMSLSMKDVDQQTGEDLCPHRGRDGAWDGDGGGSGHGSRSRNPTAPPNGSGSGAGARPPPGSGAAYGGSAASRALAVDIGQINPGLAAGAGAVSEERSMRAQKRLSSPSCGRRGSSSHPACYR